MLEKVKDFSKIHAFNCRDSDLNDFFLTYAGLYKADLLAETYVLYLKNNKKIGPLALVALANDVVKLSRPQKRRFIHHKKRYISEYPAVKVARLGVHHNAQGSGIGTYVINLLKILFTTDNRTGCRFLTVDAYNNTRVLAFYKRNEFDFLHDKDAEDRTRIMFYDLKRAVAAS
ncbi:MAG: GNAT family N-acetyltransferase [Thermodesulfobacteriota bacterium]